MQHYKGQLSTYGLSTCRKISFVALLGTRVLPPRVTIRSCLERMELKEKKERSKLTPYEYHLLINENIHFSAYAFFYTSHLCLCILEIFKVIEFLDCHNCNPLTWKLKIADSRSIIFFWKSVSWSSIFLRFRNFTCNRSEELATQLCLRLLHQRDQRTVASFTPVRLRSFIHRCELRKSYSISSLSSWKTLLPTRGTRQHYHSLWMKASNLVSAHSSSFFVPPPSTTILRSFF